MKIIYKSFFIFASRVLSIISSLITAIILATYLGPELRGQYAIIIAAAVIIFNFFCFGLKEAIIILKRKAYKFDEYLLDSLIYFLWVSISILSSISLLIYMYIYFGESLDTSTYILITVYIFTSIKIYFFEAKLISNGDIIKYSYLSMTDKILKTISIIIMVALYELKINGALMAIISSQFLCSILYYKHCHFSNFKFIIPTTNELSSIYELSLPYGFVILFTNLINNLDLIIISFFHNHYKVGLYAISIRILDLLLIFCQSVCFTIFIDAELGEKNKNEQLIIFKNIFSKVALLYIFISVFLLLYIDDLVNVLLGLDYEFSATILRYLLPGFIGMITYKLIYHFCAKDGPNKDFIIITFLALILNLFLNYITIPTYGLYGAAISKSITFLGLGLMSIFIFRGHLYSHN